jgi:hypothetical protein
MEVISTLLFAFMALVPTARRAAPASARLLSNSWTPALERHQPQPVRTINRPVRENQ